MADSVPEAYVTGDEIINKSALELGNRVFTE